ncbi:MAG: cytochrome c biogenesis CcdA family protein [Candidatus Nanopelagicales bacterium]
MTVLALATDTITSGSLLLAMPLAFVAGLVSFLSPCVAPLVPGYISLITGLSADELLEGHGHRNRALAGTIGFTLGFGILFVSYGVAFGGIGSVLAQNQSMITRGLGVLVLLLGVAYLGRIPVFEREIGPRMRGRGGVLLSPFLGVAFGLGWVPCVGPTLAAVQTLAFSEGSAWRGALLSLLYSLGLGLPFIVIGLFFERSLGALRWMRTRRHRVQQFGGVMLIVLGLLLMTGMWDQLSIWMRIQTSGFWKVSL